MLSNHKSIYYQTRKVIYCQVRTIMYCQARKVIHYLLFKNTPLKLHVSGHLIQKEISNGVSLPLKTRLGLLSKVQYFYYIPITDTAHVSGHLIQKAILNSVSLSLKTRLGLLSEVQYFYYIPITDTAHKILVFLLTNMNVHTKSNCLS